MVHPLEDGTELGCCCEGENMDISDWVPEDGERQQMDNDYEISSRIAQNALEQCLERPLSLQEKEAVRWLLGLPEKVKTYYSDGGQFFMSL